jgi:hypothetical protein
VKKPKEEIQSSVQRMYNEAERRQLKSDIKKSRINKDDQNKINIDDFFIKVNKEKESRGLNANMSKANNRIKKREMKYNFQVNE